MPRAQAFAERKLLSKLLASWRSSHVALLQEDADKMLLALQFMAEQSTGDPLSLDNACRCHATPGSRPTGLRQCPQSCRILPHCQARARDLLC